MFERPFDLGLNSLSDFLSAIPQGTKGFKFSIVERAFILFFQNYGTDILLGSLTVFFLFLICGWEKKLRRKRTQTYRSRNLNQNDLELKQLSLKEKLHVVNDETLPINNLSTTAGKKKSENKKQIIVQVDDNYSEYTAKK